jgi:rhodanese-related sulfurtransferase
MPPEKIMIPEITVTELAKKLKSQDQFVLLDVRELTELGYAKITDSRLEVTPMSGLANQGVDALPDSAKPRDAEIYVMCHHGNRSADVTRWLAAQGWTNVYNVRGGIDAYANEIDQTVGFY